MLTIPAEKDKDQRTPRPSRNPYESLLLLKFWQGKQLITTKCSNMDAIIEWLYVPYIIDVVTSSNTMEDDSNKVEAKELDIKKEPATTDKF